MFFSGFLKIKNHSLEGITFLHVVLKNFYHKIWIKFFWTKIIWQKLNYFSFFQIFEKLFVTRAKIFIKLKICKFSTVRFESQALKFKNLRQGSLDTLKECHKLYLFIVIYILFYYFIIFIF